PLYSFPTRRSSDLAPHWLDPLNDGFRRTPDYLFIRTCGLTAVNAADGRRQLTYKHNRTRSCRALPTPPVCDEDTRALERPPAGVSHSECHWQRYVSRCARAALHRLPSYLSDSRVVRSPRVSPV